MKLNNRSLKWLLTLNFLIVVAIPITVITLFTVHTLNTQLEKEIAAKNMWLARSLAGQLEKYLDSHQNTLGFMVEFLNNNPELTDRQINHYLQAMVDSYQLFDMVQILDRQGVVRYLAPYAPDYDRLNLSRQDFYINTRRLGRTYWSSSFIAIQTGQPTIAVAKPYRQGLIVGYLNVSKISDGIERVFNNQIGWLEITDQRGSYIYHSTKSFANQMINAKNNYPVQQGLHGKLGLYHYRRDGKEVLASVAVITQTGWPVLVSQYAAEAFAPVRLMRNILLGGILGGLLLAYLIARLSSRRITKPLAEFIKQSRQIASGNYQVDFQFDRQYCQEFDELAQDFAAMTQAIHAREQALQESVAERQRAETQIQASLQEKEVLLKEIHHRVKNNMQVISSLLRLQSGAINDPHIREIFGESQNRIRSMTLVHEKLYQSPDLAKIDFQEYVTLLVNSLFHSYGVSQTKVNLRIEVTVTRLAIDTAIPCGLIINELVSNALKYAFPGERIGMITVRVTYIQSNLIELTVADDGAGMPADLEPENTDTLGLQLVRTISEEQLQGRVSIRRENGTQFCVLFQEVYKDDGSQSIGCGRFGDCGA